MNRADIGRAERILDQLDPADAEWAAPRLLPPWALRARRLAERDAAVRAALSLYAMHRPKTAARLLADALDLRSRRPAAVRSPTLARLCDRVLAANGGRPLGLRQIMNIADHDRAAAAGAKKTSRDFTGPEGISSL